MSKPSAVRQLLSASMAAGALLALAACGSSSGGSGSGSAPQSSGASNSTSNGPIQVVAGEDFGGNIAEQIGGSHVHVTSIITNPNTDPHEYETDPSDAA